jgi:sulfite reductase (NADPH) hemoprotein beta-component
MTTSAGLLHEFLPASEILRVAEAVLRVFKRLGDYEHKQRNRMKFMIKTLGWTRWREEYDRELTACRLRGQVPTLDRSARGRGAASGRRIRRRRSGISPRACPRNGQGPGADAGHRSGLSGGRRRICAVAGDQCPRAKTVRLRDGGRDHPLGDLTSEQMRIVGELARAYGDGAIRVTADQDLLFRWVNTCDVAAIRRLAAAGLGLAEAGTIADVTSCPGAETCRLAVTQSRGLGRLLEDHLRERPDLIAAADGARIKISGCPNGCGLHHIATFGFQGSVRRLGSRAVPQYFVMVGGGAHDRGATFGRLAAKIPARRIPQVVERLIDLYAKERGAGESATEFFGRVELGVVKGLLADLETLRPGDAVSTDFIDLAESAEFAPEVMDGECSA